MLNSRDSVASLRSKLDFIEQIDSPQQLQQIAQKYQQQPNGAAIISAALARAQNLRQLQSGILASDKAGSVGAPPIASQAIASINPRALPEDVGIGRLPAPNIARMAEGGIVAFAGGNKVESDPVQDFATQYKPLAEQVGAELDVDPGLILAQWGHETGWGKGVPGRYNLGNIKGKGTTAYDRIEKSRSQYKDYGSPEEFAQDYVSQIKRNWPGVIGAKQDVGAFTAGLEKGRLGKYATDEGYGKKLASAVTKALPFSSARAEALPAPKGRTSQAAPQPAPEEDDTVYDPTTGLPMYGSQTRAPAEDITIRERMGLGNIANRKAIEAAAAAKAEANRTAFSTGEYRGKSGDVEEDIGPAQAPLPPKKEKELIAAAKEAIPASERKGWTNDMLLQFFLSMAAGDSPSTAKNIATAGLSALKYGQEAKKAEMEQRKMEQEMALSKAHEKYYGAAAQRYEAEDKPLAQMRKEIAAAHLKLNADKMLALDPAKLAAAKRQATAEIMANYPELADTIKLPSTATGWSAVQS